MGFLQSKYKLNYERANALAPISFWISAVFTPFFGFLCDFYGKRTMMMLLSGICLLFGHALLGFVGSEEQTLIIPIFGLMSLGFGYSFGAASIWPSFGLIVKQKYLATTLGVWGSIDNAFQACMSLCVGLLSKEYNTEERQMYNDQFDDARYLWIGLSLGMIIWTLLLWCVDAMKFGNTLWQKSQTFEDKKMSDLCCTIKKSEEINQEEKGIDDDLSGLDGKTRDVGIENSENEDGLLVDDVTNDQVLGISGFTAYDL